MRVDRDVLVVDDEPVVLAAAGKVLAHEGLSLDVAASVEEALERLRSFRYRVVLSDLKLPGVGGLELITECRVDVPPTPVIMITGFATLDSAIRSFKRGAFDYLPKPFDAGELLGVVRRAIGFAAAGGRSAAARDPAGALGSSEIYALGLHSWAALRPSGSTRIGMGETFLRADDVVRTLELPEEDDEILQGNRCARITTASELVHNVWAPLSGRVVEVNGSLDPHDANCRTSSIASSWLISVVPTNADEELPNLTYR